MTSINLPQIASAFIKTNIFNERFLYDINRENFSKISSTEIFNESFKEKIFNENSLYIIIGTDSGLLPRYIKKNGVPIGTRYLFIETDYILNQLHKYKLINELSDEIRCVSYDQWETVAAELKIAQYIYINSVVLLSSISAQGNTLEDYSELNWTVTENLRNIQWQCGMQLASESFITRQIENVAENHTPASVLEGAFKGETAIILAGGPSLTSILPWVKQNRTKLVVLSVARISKQLIKEGITPDFVFSVDPYKLSFNNSYDMLSFGDKPVLIHTNHIYPGLLNQWQGKSLYLSRRLPWDSDLNVENLSGSGPTVTNTALWAAYNFGFDRILLAGVDLCYSKSGITHAEGSAEQLAGAKYNTTTLQVETYSGEYRGTGEDFLSALRSLGVVAKLVIDKDREVINLSEDAAIIDHVVFRKASKVPLHECKANVEAMLLGKYSADEESNRKYYKALLEELSIALTNMNDISCLAKKAHTMNAEMYNSDGVISNYKDKKKLDKLEKTLQKKYGSYSKLVQNFGIRELVKINVTHDEHLLSSDHVKELGAIYYDAYQDGAKKLSDLLSSAIDRIKSRQEESKASPDFESLVKQWRKDDSYRRADMWVVKHGDKNLSAKEKNKFLELSNEFIEYKKQADQELYAGMQQERSNIFYFKNKAKILFKHKKLEELDDLKQNFLQDSKNSEKKDYLSLISAYIAELNLDASLAEQYYHEILELEGSELLEDALNGIVNISIEKNNYQNIFMALECLSQISPVYLPYYAESARILGKIQIATDSYMAYIEIFPEDKVTQLKLVSLYMENDMSNVAEVMLDYMLSQDSTLESAILLKQKILKG